MKDRLDQDLEAQYPKLNAAGYKITSKKDKKYNCVAWAAERDQERWWEPLNEPGCYWPKEVPFNHSFENYVKVFGVLGYSYCDNPSLEDGIEKVALFSDVFGFTHVSHQLEDGRWTSKLGPDEDIKHTVIGALESNGVLPAYGMVTRIMKRRRQIWEQSNQKPKLPSLRLGFLRTLLKKFFLTRSVNQISN
ncbi:MAG: hypothetical protein ABSD57_03035 [Verrucomicrobiota bacterium]